MKISLATNFDNLLIEKIKNKNVYELYGRMTNDIFCGGRPLNSLNKITQEVFESHVKAARENGINFNYLLNGACDSNKSQSKTWQKQFVKFLFYLKNVGVNAFTITNPLILKIIKKHYPSAICRVSTFSCVDCLEKAKYWEELGADIICADFVKINRNFEELQKIVNGLKRAKLEILTTNSCIKYCPYIHTHVNCIAHASQHNSSSGYIDWCLLACQYQQLKKPEEYIKSPWVRPEDVKYYEEIGIEHFKITERDFPTEILVERLEAYNKREYNGNLLNLIQGHGYKFQSTPLQPLIKKTKFKDINEILSEIFLIRGYKQERKFSQHCWIDNKKLNGFLEFFKQNNCKGDCSNCNYCKNIAAKTISTNDEITSYLIDLYEKLDNNLY